MNCTGVLGDERNMPEVRRLGGGFSAWRAPHSIQLGALHVWAAYEWSNGVKDQRARRPRGSAGATVISKESREGKGKEKYVHTIKGRPSALRRYCTRSSQVVSLTNSVWQHRREKRQRCSSSLVSRATCCRSFPFLSFFLFFYLQLSSGSPT